MNQNPMQPSLQQLYDAIPGAAAELTQVVHAFAASGSGVPHAPTLLLRQAAPYLAQSPLVLVSGPTGIGKSYLIDCVANHFKVQTTTLLPGLIDLYFPHLPERGVDYHFYAAKKRAVELGPGRFALVLDNIDTFFTNPEMGFALLHNLRTLLSESATGCAPFLVLATVRDPDQVPDAFRSFVTDTIAMALPTQSTRPALLSLALTTVDPTCTTAQHAAYVPLATLPTCSSFLYADYVSLAHLVLSTPAADLTTLPSQIRASTVHTSATTASVITPTVTFTSLGGLSHVRTHLTRSFLWPRVSPYAEGFPRLHLAPTSGILLVGPPGTGKTLVASALAGECGVPFFAVSVAQLVRGHVGESEKQVARVFAQARGVAGGSVVFLDEVDAVFAGAGEMASKMVAQLVLELDTCAAAAAARGRVVVVAATNHPWRLSEALVRPGRLDTHVYVGLPDEDERRDMLRKMVGEEGWGVDEWVDQVAARTEAYSGADLSALVTRARAIMASSNGPSGLTCGKAIMMALDKVRPSVKREDVEKVEQWMKRNV